MTTVRRLIAVGGILMLAAVFTGAYVLGEPARRDQARPGAGAAAKDSDFVGEDQAASRFADAPILTYTTKDGEHLIAVQLRPELPAAKPLPRDLVVLVDTSASQAGGHLLAAEKLVAGLVAKLGDEDRVSIRTVNVKSADLSRGFQPARQLDAALAALNNELPMGAADFKTALDEALKSFKPDANRRQAIVYLGDGMSVRNPLGPGDVPAFAERMVRDHIAFFPVPVGPRLEPSTLHGLASRTGGAPIRLTLKGDMDAIAKQLVETAAAPVLYGATIDLPAEVTDHYPTTLPPLRGDAPTLLVGHVKPLQTLSYTIKGTVDGQDVTLKGPQLKVPAPEVDNFFLAGMVRQWQTAKDQPALIRADRALAFALEHHQLARADLIAQGELALGESRYDIAANLFAQARDIDPTSAEAKAMVDLVEQLRDGKITKEQLRDAIKANKAKGHVGQAGDPAGNLVAFQPPDKPGPAKPGADKPEQVAPPVPGPDILGEARRRQMVENQKATGMVEDVIRQAQRALPREPDAARDYLKRALDAIRSDANVGAETRERLSRRLEAALADAEIRGERIKAEQAAALNIAVRTEEARRTIATQEAMESRIKERMRVFHNLMNQARDDEAYRQAQDIRQDLINQGAPVPNAVTAAYMVGEVGYNLREIRELRRVREERFLLAMLGVERSHVPFPDEPPIQFPPTATWRKITELRRGKYESSRLIGEISRRSEDLLKQMSAPVKFGGFDDPETKLDDVLQYLQRAYNINFEINEQAFKDEMIDNVREKAIQKAIPKMNGVALSTVLRKVLERIPAPSGTTWLIRNGEVEITTARYAAAEKAVVAYPIADLAIPITTAQQTGSVLQPGQLFGVVGYQGIQGVAGLAGIGGLAGVAGLAGIGGLGGIGGLAGIGGLGGLAGIGGLGGLAGIAGLAGGGLQGIGGLAGAAGNAGQAGIAGVAGIAGFQGLAGQQGGGANVGFGQLGGTQAPLLLRLITQLVGEPDEWLPIDRVQQIGIPNEPGGNPDELDKKPNRNALAFYPPALSLVVKGSSRIQTRPSAPIIKPPGEQAALDRRNDNFKVAGAGNDRGDRVKKKHPLEDADPKEVWQDALAKGVEEPGLIIACSDFLAMFDKWDHVAELLKANLRQGIIVRPWVYEALAVALRETKASPEEIERAEVSAADLEPLDADGFLKAAKALGKDHPEAALAFCRQAAQLQPNVAAPYRDALAYAGRLGDLEGLEWSAGRLLERDWPADNAKLHDNAEERLKELAGKLSQGEKKEAAEKLLARLREAARRDLEITLSWIDGTSPVDLDLLVEEPVGSFCSWRNKQTIGGGLLLGGDLKSKKQTYVVAQAFPGVYKVSVERVFGHPPQDKAQLRVVRHKGTPQQREEIITVHLNSKEPVLIKLDDGRRTQIADVPPPAAAERLSAATKPAPTTDALGQLQRVADPDTTVDGGPPIGIETIGRLLEEDQQLPDPSKQDEVVYQTRVKPFFNNQIDMSVQAVLSADRRYVRLNVSGAFNVITGTKTTGRFFFNPTLPGNGFPPLP